MGVDIKDLAPWAQKQAAMKLAAQQRSKAESAEKSKQVIKKPNKYHNEPTERITADGKVIKFDSQKEARRYDELMLLLNAGKIFELKLQPQFTLQEAYTMPNGNHVNAIRYVADFSYNTGAGLVVEDVKGGRATQTRVYKLKKKLMAEKGIVICEV